MAIDAAVVRNVGKALTGPLGEAIAREVAGKGGQRPVNALALEPSSPPARTGVLYSFLRLVSADARTKRVKFFVELLREELPGVLNKTPLRPSHFGFERIDQLIDFIAAELVRMETSATDEAAFIRGIKGWESNFVGRILFERLVKYHPQLTRFFAATAKDFIALANTERQSGATPFIDAAGNAVAVKSDFGKPFRIVELTLVGADGVPRAFTDLGYMSGNANVQWAMLPIELKLPAALGGVAQQFSEFRLRVGEALGMIARVEEGGKIHEFPINPKDLVFMRDDLGQMAVAPLSQKQFQAALATGEIPSAKFLPRDVGSVIRVDQRTSPTRGVIYYQVRVLVQRSWLESIVRIITGR